MKKISTIACALLLLGACQSKPEGFVIKGELTGAPENKWIYLTDYDQKIYYDSTQLKNGHFEFEGKLEYPELCRITYFKDPSQRIYGWSNILSVPVFVENATIHFSVPFTEMPTKSQDVMPGSLQITGSTSHNLYREYWNIVAPLMAKDDSLFTEYQKTYYYKMGTEEDVFRCVTEMDAIKESIFNTGKDFIRNHPESYVALYVATTLDVARYGRNEAQTIAALIPESIKASPKGQAAVKALLECPMYKGDQLPDFDVYNTNLQIVKLSSLLKEGHYMLVELWASWCGPCRADIPHLKETYERYHGKGFEMVSISVDDDTSAWLKAVKEEGMPWTQACGVNGKGYDKECLNLFGVRGVPSCVLIDGNGKVLSTSCRGSWLNKTLATLYQE